MEATVISAELYETLTRSAKEWGADLVGCCGAPVQDPFDVMPGWLASGAHAEMRWMERACSHRSLPPSALWWRSALVIGVSVGHGPPPVLDEGEARIADYAVGDDYHDVLGSLLQRLIDVWHAHAPQHRLDFSVDVTPVSERALAVASGLGWIGRNGMLIHPEWGSRLMLGVIYSDQLPLKEPRVITDRCGACRRCIDACPAQAIRPDRTVDCRRCLSYQTIEHRGEWTGDTARVIGSRVFGCDTCQDVCPYNAPSAECPRRGASVRCERLLPRIGMRPFKLPEGEITGEWFQHTFAGSAVLRCRLNGFRRNVKAVLQCTGALGAVCNTLNSDTAHCAKEGMN